MAEMENLRKRTQKEVSDARRFGATSLAKDLIDGIENLILADKSIPDNDDEIIKNIATGIALTKKDLLKALEKNNITRISPEGQIFDSNQHQAIVELPSDKAAGTIVDVMQAGYKIADRILRPAMVAVAKAVDEVPENKEGA